MPTAANGSVEIHFETFGNADDPTLLLVNGLGSQCINYAADWCRMFAERGFHVIRFDNRDVGLSTHLVDAVLGERGNAYTVDDMALDAIGVLDAAGVERTHVMGLSMGGIIVQHLAIDHADRLLSMTAVMTRTEEPGYGHSSPEAGPHMLTPPPPDRAGSIERHIEDLRVWGSDPELVDEEHARASAAAAYDRSFDPSGVLRQYMAIVASAPWSHKLSDVTVPTLVMHGDRDTLIDISGGRRVAELIPGARFEVIDGMGHDYPPSLWPRWTDLVAGFALAQAT